MSPTPADVASAYDGAVAAIAAASDMRKRSVLTSDRCLEALVREAEAELVVATSAETLANQRADIEYKLAYGEVDAARDALQKTKDDSDEMRRAIHALIDKFIEENPGVSVRHGSFSTRTKQMNDALETAIRAAEKTQVRTETDARIASAAVLVGRAKVLALTDELRTMRDDADADDADDAVAMARLAKRCRTA